MVPGVFVDIVDSSCGLEDERHPSYDPLPDGDGRPIAGNAPQLLITQTLDLGFRHLFAGRDDVYASSDVLWYPYGTKAGRLTPASSAAGACLRRGRKAAEPSLYRRGVGRPWPGHRR